MKAKKNEMRTLFLQSAEEKKLFPHVKMLKCALFSDFYPLSEVL